MRVQPGSPLVLVLLSSLMVLDNLTTWAANRSTIASLERARSDLRLEMEEREGWLPCLETIYAIKNQ